MKNTARTQVEVITDGLILHKAIDRYYRDAESSGRPLPEHPTSRAPEAVDRTKRVVHLEGSGGHLASYAFSITRRGYVRFRPEWTD
jgi:hypothetical protein